MFEDMQHFADSTKKYCQNMTKYSHNMTTNCQEMTIYNHKMTTYIDNKTKYAANMYNKLHRVWILDLGLFWKSKIWI